MFKRMTSNPAVSSKPAVYRGQVTSWFPKAHPFDDDTDGGAAVIIAARRTSSLNHGRRSFAMTTLIVYRMVRIIIEVENDGDINIKSSPDQLALYIDMLLLSYKYLPWSSTSGQINRLQRQAAPTIVSSKDEVPSKTQADISVLPILKISSEKVKVDEDVVVLDETLPAVLTTKTPLPFKKSETASYQCRKANDPLYIHYSLWSVFSIVNTALVDDPDLVLFVASVSVLLTMSLAVKLAPERFNPEVVKTADKLVIGLSGVRDVSRIMTTFALSYWALPLHAGKEVIQTNVTASDILLGVTTDPLFWAMIGVIGLANGIMKYKIAANPDGRLSIDIAKLEKGVRGTYMACSTSTMAILLLDCMTSLLSNAMKSGYGLLLAEPVSAAVTFTIIAAVAVVGAYCGVTAQREPESAVAKTFDRCDKTLAKTRKILMPIAVVASLLCPELIILGALLAIVSLFYDKYQEKKNTDKAGQRNASPTADAVVQANVLSGLDGAAVQANALEQEDASSRLSIGGC